ncbi:MAG TPA: M56 family metallopeptidase [Micromonosporaceae bacterium]|nr:M56 family metallopeptidase [Micromonosporaceae bacterium]
MISLLLLCWAAVVAVAAGPALANRAWTRSAPRLAVGVWLGAELSVTLAVLGAGLLLAVPPAAAAAGLPGIVQACLQALANLSAPNLFLSIAGLAAMALLIARLAVGLTVTFTAARRWRRHHRAALLPVSRPGPDGESVILDHAVPVIYCLPGRPGQIVVTSGALDVLSPQEFAAVLGHEQAHLRGRHHLLLALVTAFHRAFPGLPLAGTAEAEVRRLVEHLADDRAGAQHDRRLMASAIVRLADATPEHALGAATAAADRVRRMLAPATPLRAAQRLLATAAIGALLALPLAAVAATAGTALHGSTCSHPSGVKPPVQHPQAGNPAAAA